MLYPRKFIKCYAILGGSNAPPHNIVKDIPISKKSCPLGVGCAPRGHD